MPAHNASNVSTFGMSRLTEKPDSRRTRMRGRRTRTRVRRMANELLFTASVAGAEYTRCRGFRGTGPSVGKSAIGRPRRVSVGEDRLAGDHPSAGLTISPGRVGVTRQGSRKKYAIHRVRISAAHPAGGHSRKRIRVAIAAIAMNFHPSG